MHTLRLLDMAIEIFRDGELRVLRPDRDFLLDVKTGKFSLGEVLQMAEERLVLLEKFSALSSLPQQVDPAWISELLVEMREELFS